MERYGTATIRHMRTACYITEATDTHSEYVILIVFHGKMIRRRPFTFMCLSTLRVVFANSSHRMTYPCVNMYIEHQGSEATGRPRLQASKRERRITSLRRPETSVCD